MPLTAAEIIAHPEYEHVNWHLKPEKKAKLAVASGRGGPFEIAYEIHGNGPRHLVVSKHLFIALSAVQGVSCCTPIREETIACTSWSIFFFCLLKNQLC